MTTTNSQTHATDLELLHTYIGESLRNGGRLKSVDDVLGEFREYLTEVERLREEIRPALERSLRGESKPIDWEALKRRCRELLAEKGITSIPSSPRTASVTRQFSTQKFAGCDSSPV